MIDFQNPQFLFSFILLILGFIITYSQFNKTKKKSIQFSIIKHHINQLKFRIIFFTTAFVFIILGIAQPRWGSRSVFEKRRGSTIMFVMDISKSMTVSDIKPNRIEIAKAYAKLLLNELDNVSCGLVLAKGDGVLSIPATFDKQIMETTLNFINVNSLSSVGTNLELGIIKAINSFPNKSATSKTIILFTDGDETLGNLSKTIKLLKNNKIKLVIIGFGTTNGTNISIHTEENIQKTINTSLKEKKLKQVVDTMGKEAIYVRFNSHGSITNIISKIDLKDNKIETIEKIQRPAKRTFEMSLLALFFLALGFFFGGKRW